MCAQNKFCTHTVQTTLGRFAPVTLLPFSLNSGLRPETRCLARTARARFVAPALQVLATRQE